MKILHIVDHLGSGGAQTIVRGIFESQKKNKDIFLFALRKGRINTEIDHLNVKVFNSGKKYSFGPLKELKNIVEKEGINILHCHLLRSQFFGYLLKKKCFPNIKLIFHEHGKIFQSNFWYPFLLNKFQKRVNLFIAVSKATKNKLIKKADINFKKIVVLYNFVDLDKFNRKNITWNIQEEKEKLGIKKDDFVIGFMGRLNKVKGCKYLIKAFPHLHFPYKVLITGDGPLNKSLNKLTESLNIKKNVRFWGYIKDVKKFYSLLDVYVMPSLSEASPVVFYEAQALGVPIIGSNVNAINEFVISNKNGLLFKVRDEIDLAKKIKLYLRNNDLRKEMIKNSLGNIEKYSLRGYLEKLNIIYEGIYNP
jgi:L-malate glycosyltransferase